MKRILSTLALLALATHAQALGCPISRVLNAKISMDARLVA